MPKAEPITRTSPGLVENAAGQLKCPVCREPIFQVMLCHAQTMIGSTMVLPSNTTVHPHLAKHQAELPPGMSSITVGVECRHEHTVYLRLVASEDTLKITTEWDEQNDRD